MSTKTRNRAMIQPWKPAKMVHSPREDGGGLMASVQQVYVKKAKKLFNHNKPLPQPPAAASNDVKVEVSTKEFLDEDELLVKTEMPKLYRTASAAPLRRPVRRKNSATATAQSQPTSPHQGASQQGVKDMLQMKDSRQASLGSSTAAVNEQPEHIIRLTRSVEKLSFVEDLLKEACGEFDKDKDRKWVQKFKLNRAQSVESLSKLNFKQPSPLKSKKSKLRHQVSPDRNSMYSFFDYTNVSDVSVSTYQSNMQSSSKEIMITVYVDCDDNDTILIRHQLDSRKLAEVKEGECRVLTNVVEQVVNKMQEMTSTTISDEFKVSYKANDGTFVMLIDDCGLKKASEQGSKITLRISN